MLSLSGLCNLWEVRLLLFLYFSARNLVSSASTVQLESSCNSGHIVVAYDNSDASQGVVVSVKSWPLGEQQTTVFTGASLPGVECGDTYVRCNLTTVFDATSGKVAVTVPLTQGVGLVLYDFVNNSITYRDHFLLPSLDNGCHITQFFNSTGSIIGHCINVTSDDSLRHVQLNVNFTDLTQSTLSQVAEPSQLAFPDDISQSVYFKERARCFDDDADASFVFTIDGPSIDRVDLRDKTLEFFAMFDVSLQPPIEIDCVSPRRVKRYDDSILAIYCRNLTIELDVCQLRTTSISVQAYHNSEGVLYNCTSDPRIFVLEKNGNLTVPLMNTEENITIPLPPDLQEIYTADCFLANEELHLVSTSTRGHTVSLKSQQSFTTLGTSDNLIPHTMYGGPSALFNSNGTSLLYNFSCPLNPVVATIDHPFKLSTVIEGSEPYSCTCSGPSTTEVPTNNSTTMSTASTEEPKDHTSTIIASAVSVGVVALIITSVVVTIIIVFCIFHFKRQNNDGAQEDPERKPIEATTKHEESRTPHIPDKQNYLDGYSRLDSKAKKKISSKDQKIHATSDVPHYLAGIPLLEPAERRPEDTKNPSKDDHKFIPSGCTVPTEVTSKEKNAKNSITPTGLPVPPVITGDQIKLSAEPCNRPRNT